MNPILKTLIFCFAITFELTGLAQTVDHLASASRPEATVRSLYTKVQNRAPSGLLDEADMRIFAPYFSKTLRRKMDLAGACAADWNRQHRGQIIKAPFAWSEFGMFSGANERTSPATFHIESIHKAKDGSFEIVVGLTYRPGEGPGSWHVKDHVVQEDGRFVLDDVFFPEENSEESSTLVGILSEGCDGSRWIGERNQR
jgi:hypothetical protein